MNICEKKHKGKITVNIRHADKERRILPKKGRVNDWRIFSKRDRNGMRERKREREMKWALPLAAFCLRAFLFCDDVMRTGPGQTGLLMLFREEGPNSFTSQKDSYISLPYSTQICVSEKKLRRKHKVSVCVCVCALLCIVPFRNSLNCLKLVPPCHVSVLAFCHGINLLSFDVLNIRHWVYQIRQPNII